MTTTLSTYLSFEKNARTAMEFYHSVFGGDLTINTFKEQGSSNSPEQDNLIMHSQLKTEGGINIMASDTVVGKGQGALTRGNDFSLSINGTDLVEITAYYEKLIAGGTVTVPLAASPWGDTFAMFKDKFGMQWMINVTKA